MSIIRNKDFNGLELGLQRRTNFQFTNVVAGSPIVLRFTSSCCYRIIARSLQVYTGGLQYDVVVNPTSIDTAGTTQVPIFRNNTKIQSTPIQTEVTSGWVITYNDSQVVDRTIVDLGKSKEFVPPPDYQEGGRIFTENDVFYLVIRRFADAETNPSGFLNLLWQEELLGIL